MIPKFKMTLNITHEEMIRMLAHYAPFEITAIHEVMEDQIPNVPPNIAALVDQVKKRHAKKTIKRFTKPNLKEGMNAIIMKELGTGSKTTIELRAALVKGGYSPHSVTSQMTKLESHGIVERKERGVWVPVDSPE